MNRSIKSAVSVLCVSLMLCVPVTSSESRPIVSVCAEAASVSKPQGLKATETGSSSVTLEWKKVSGAKSYIVYMYDSGEEMYVECKRVTSAKAVISGLSSQKTYKFKVSAVSSDGKESAVSSALSVKTKGGSTKELYRSYLPYHYRKLSEKEKKAYLDVRRQIIDHNSVIEISIFVDHHKLLNLTELDPLIYDVAGYAYSDKKGNVTSVRIDVKYSFSKSEYDRKNEAILKEVKSINKKVSGKSDYEKLVYFRDHIIRKCTYDTSVTSNSVANVGNAYGCLIEGKAVCLGYVRAFGMLCSEAGIDSVIILGDDLNTKDDVTHVWNKVRLGGKWYNVDVTWDDLDHLSTPSYYANFMRSDKVFQKDHTFTEIEGYTDGFDAKDDSRSYFNTYGYHAKSFDDAVRIVTEKGSRLIDSGVYTVNLTFENLSDAEKFYDYCYNSGKKLTDAIDKKTKVDVVSGRIYIQTYKTQKTIIVTFFVKGEKSQVDADAFGNSEYYVRLLKSQGVIFEDFYKP